VSSLADGRIGRVEFAAPTCVVELWNTMLSQQSPRSQPVAPQPVAGAFSPRSSIAAPPVFQHQAVQLPLQNGVVAHGSPRLRMLSPVPSSGSLHVGATVVNSAAGGSFTLAPPQRGVVAAETANGTSTPISSSRLPNGTSTPISSGRSPAPQASPSPVVNASAVTYTTNSPSGSSPSRASQPTRLLSCYGNFSTASTPAPSTPASANGEMRSGWTKNALAEKLRYKLERQQQQLQHSTPQQQQRGFVVASGSHQRPMDVTHQQPQVVVQQTQSQHTSRVPSQHAPSPTHSQRSLHQQASPRSSMDGIIRAYGRPVGTPTQHGASTPIGVAQTLTPTVSSRLIGGGSVSRASSIHGAIAPSGSMRLLTPRLASQEGLGDGHHHSHGGVMVVTRPIASHDVTGGTDEISKLSRQESAPSIGGASRRARSTHSEREAICAARQSVLVSVPHGHAGQVSESRSGTGTPRILARMVSAPELRQGEMHLSVSSGGIVPYTGGGGGVIVSHAGGGGDLVSLNEEDAIQPYWGSAGEISVAASCLSVGTLLALQSDALRVERRNLVKAQEKNKIWLKKALTEQVKAFEHDTALHRIQPHEEKEKRRDELLRSQSLQTLEQLQAKKDTRELRELKYLENRVGKDHRRRESKGKIQQKEKEREERIVSEKFLQLEEASVRAHHEGARRRAISEDAKRFERTRCQMIKERNDIEAEKAEALQLEKKRLHELRRTMLLEGQEARDMLKKRIHHMKVKSHAAKNRPHTLRSQVEDMISSSIYDPELADM